MFRDFFRFGASDQMVQVIGFISYMVDNVYLVICFFNPITVHFFFYKIGFTIFFVFLSNKLSQSHDLTNRLDKLTQVG
jgi:hypothetical protein